MRRKRGAAKLKVVKIEIIPRETPKAKDPGGLISWMYETMDSLVERFHTHLGTAKIALAWKRGNKADSDGRLNLGKAGKIADALRQLSGFDWVILLNSEAFEMFSPLQRAALIDHELCHCQQAVGKDGDQKKDAQGKLLWRVRKHDVEEFKEIIQRHGLWKSDLEEFYAAAKKAAEAPLFAKQTKEGKAA